MGAASGPGRRADGRADTGRGQVEPVAALEHAHDRCRGDAFAQRGGPRRDVVGLEREAAERVAAQRVEPCGDERSEEHTSELQSLAYLVCRLLLEKKKNPKHDATHTFEWLVAVSRAAMIS